MRKALYFNKLAPLLDRPFFNSKEAKELGVGTSVLHHYVKAGRLERVQRGLYRSIAEESKFRGLRWTDLIQAVCAIPHGVICLISALAIYDLTEAIPRQHWIAIPHGKSVKKNRLLKIIHLRNIELGKTSIELEGSVVPIFDRERTIIDAFRLLSRETAIKSLRMALQQKGAAKLDLQKLENYAKQLRCNIEPYLLSETT